MDKVGHLTIQVLKAYGFLVMSLSYFVMLFFIESSSSFDINSDDLIK